MKSAPVLMPWLTIWITAPCTPAFVPENRPSTMNPRWLTLEYATRRFMSGCTIATSAP